MNEQELADQQKKGQQQTSQQRWQQEMLRREAWSAETAARRLVNLTNIEGATDNATVVVHRASPQSGAHTAIVTTTGNGEQEINLGAAPTRLMFTPPGLVVEKRELPKNLDVSGQTITVIRYTNSGFIIDDHKHSDIHVTVYMAEGNPAKE